MLPNDRLMRTIMIIVAVLVILGLVFGAVGYPT